MAVCRNIAKKNRQQRARTGKSDREKLKFGRIGTPVDSNPGSQVGLPVNSTTSPVKVKVPTDLENRYHIELSTSLVGPSEEDLDHPDSLT